MTLDASWFSQPYDKANSAFSLKLKNNQPLHQEQSPYQHIAVYETESFGRLLVIDGVIMLTDRENYLYHEMMAHPALFTHPNPKRVLIIGGGDCGTLREVLKHDSVEKVTQIDIDEAVTRAATQFFPKLTESNHDPRADLRFIDGLKWMREAQAGSYDVIIIDSTDPIGPAVDLFALDFFKDCYNALADNGVLVNQSESPFYDLDDILLPLHLDLRKAGFIDTHSLHYFQPVYPSGWWTATLSCKSAQVSHIREQDILNKTFETDYYNLDIHRAAMATPEHMKRKLRAVGIDI